MPRPLIEEEGKRYSLSARTTLELNLALKEAAKKNGRSVAQEIELRLEKSFEAERIERELSANLVERSIDFETDTMIKSMRGAVGAVMLYFGSSWVTDIYTRVAVRSALNGVRASYFSVHKIEVDQENFDAKRFNNAESVGGFYGRVMSFAGASDENREMIRRLIDTMDSIPSDASEPNDKVRRSAAIDELNGVVLK